MVGVRQGDLSSTRLCSNPGSTYASCNVGSCCTSCIRDMTLLTQLHLMFLAWLASATVAESTYMLTFVDLGRSSSL